MAPDRSLVERLSKHGQSHLLSWWDDLGEGDRARLLGEVEAIDLEEIESLVKELVNPEASGSQALGRVEPIEVFRLPKTDGERVTRRHVAEIG
ncbi:UTP--glucose-1-phosphate uridylyltransferase, partial [Singulisphaera rosea]